MNLIKTSLREVLLIEPQKFGDHRGWFMESYSKREFEKLGITEDFMQHNHSFSATKGTLRGLHFQKKPFAQTKIIRCTKGEILDVAVDIRKQSPTYKQWVSVMLSAENGRMLYVPQGFAHGFLTLAENTEVQYMVDQYYAPESDRSIRFDDPAIGVNWNISDPIVSQKDQCAPLLEESDADF